MKDTSLGLRGRQREISVQKAMRLGSAVMTSCLVFLVSCVVVLTN